MGKGLSAYINSIGRKATDMVKISSQGEALSIEPEKANITKGTVVYWVNVQEGEVQVVFEEGKKCEDLTEMGSGFRPDWSACYVTDYLPRYETSRLRFAEPGTFDYVVKAASGAKGKGRIVVK